MNRYLLIDIIDIINILSVNECPKTLGSDRKGDSRDKDHLREEPTRNQLYASQRTGKSLNTKYTALYN